MKGISNIPFEERCPEPEPDPATLTEPESRDGARRKLKLKVVYTGGREAQRRQVLVEGLLVFEYRAGSTGKG